MIPGFVLVASRSSGRRHQAVKIPTLKLCPPLKREYKGLTHAVLFRGPRFRGPWGAALVWILRGLGGGVESGDEFGGGGTTVRRCRWKGGWLESRLELSP